MSKKSSSWSNGWNERASWKEGTFDKFTSGESQSFGSTRESDQHHKKKESKWIEMAVAFYENGNAHVCEESISAQELQIMPEKRGITSEVPHV